MLRCYKGVDIATLTHLRARWHEIWEDFGVEHVLRRAVLPIQDLKVLLSELALLQVVLLLHLGEIRLVFGPEGSNLLFLSDHEGLTWCSGQHRMCVFRVSSSLERVASRRKSGRLGVSGWQQRVRVVSQAPGVVAVIDSRAHVSTEAERV